MSYEVINQELGVYSCNIADLTPEQTNYFLKLWNDGTSIETLTVFHDIEGKIVINADNKEFEIFKKLTVDYLMLPIDLRKPLKDSMKAKSIIEIINVLDNALLCREKKKEHEEFKSLEKLLDKQETSWNEFEVINRLYDSREAGSESLSLLNIYHYGFIQGKRAERARRKKVMSYENSIM